MQEKGSGAPGEIGLKYPGPCYEDWLRLWNTAWDAIWNEIKQPAEVKVPYTQNQLNTTRALISELLAATKKKESYAVNSIAALGVVLEDLPAEARKLNEYLE